MKRFFKRLINEFKSKTKFEKGIWVAWTVLVITIGIIVVAFTDMVPATENDYKPLIEKAEAIEENSNLLFKEDGDFSIKNGIITTIFENSECNIFVMYDQNMKILSITKYDKALPTYLVPILAILVGICGGFLTIFFSLMLILVFLFLWEYVICKILKKINLRKNKL